MTKMGKMIEQGLIAKGKSQSDLARFVEVSPQAVQKWVAGKTEPRGRNLDRAAEFLGLTPAVLKFGHPNDGPTIFAAAQEHTTYSVQGKQIDSKAASNIIALHPEDSLPEGMVSIKQSNVLFSAGNGHEVTYEIIENSEPATYQLSWFQKERINPDRVKRFKVTGRSQEPMLWEGDTVLVNLAETNVVDGKLYAIRYGDDLRVKFLTRRLDGTLILGSMNPNNKDEEVPPELANEQITIIGRVRDKSGKGGL